LPTPHGSGVSQAGLEKENNKKLHRAIYSSLAIVKKSLPHRFQTRRTSTPANHQTPSIPSIALLKAMEVRHDLVKGGKTSRSPASFKRLQVSVMIF
jgi:hypothetical protein